MSGTGLTQAALSRLTTFSIVAYSDNGIRFDEGGDNYTVSIRFSAQGTRVRGRVSDNGDGSYTASYKPTSSGKCEIHVSLRGDHVAGMYD